MCPILRMVAHRVLLNLIGIITRLEEGTKNMIRTEILFPPAMRGMLRTIRRLLLLSLQLRRRNPRYPYPLRFLSNSSGSVIF